MKYSYYPGCAMTATGVEYCKSLEYVNDALGIEFIEIPDWNCCGATTGHLLSKELGAALPARNLALCEQQELGLEIAVACAACYSRMKQATHAVRADSERLSSLIEMPVTGNLEIVSLLEIYNRPDVREKITEAIRYPLAGMKAACYYGCLYVRPTELVELDDPEYPEAMDSILAMTGATPVDWAFKTECCGASRHVDLPAQCREPLYRILRNARASGADCIVTACPMCMMNLDMRQKSINMAYGEEFQIPVFFITELLAMAMGATTKECGINTHFVPAKQYIQDVLLRSALHQEVK